MFLYFNLTDIQIPALQQYTPDLTAFENHVVSKH